MEYKDKNYLVSSGMEKQFLAEAQLLNTRIQRITIVIPSVESQLPASGDGYISQILAQISSDIKSREDLLQVDINIKGTDPMNLQQDYCNIMDGIDGFIQIIEGYLPRLLYLEEILPSRKGGISFKWAKSKSIQLALKKLSIMQATWEELSKPVYQSLNNRVEFRKTIQKALVTYTAIIREYVSLSVDTTLKHVLSGALKCIENIDP